MVINVKVFIDMARISVEQKCDLIRQMKEEQKNNQTKLGNMHKLLYSNDSHFDKEDVSNSRLQNTKGSFRLRLFLSFIIFLLFCIFSSQNTCIYGYNMEMISQYIGESKIDIKDWIKNEKISFR